ncbi:MAG: hypothetical protein AB3N33_03105 [Puniceicoccaceae bacterium]
MKNPNCPVRSLFFRLAGMSALMACFPACVQVKTEPIRIEPIYIEITVNHKVQQELDDLFADIDQASDTADYAPVTTPEE